MAEVHLTQDLTWLDRYVGIPSETLNCWDLVRHVYRDRWGVTLGEAPEPADWYEVDPDRAMLGDVLAFHNERDGWHVGLWVRAGDMLSTQDGYASAIESFDRPGWRRRFVGVYRYTGSLAGVRA